jgi:hypothetical protein
MSGNLTWIDDRVQALVGQSRMGEDPEGIDGSEEEESGGELGEHRRGSNEGGTGLNESGGGSLETELNTRRGRRGEVREPGRQ